MTLNLISLAAPQGGGSGLLALAIQFGAIILIFWFLLIRPQRQAQKKHQAMVRALGKGDDIMTDGGILGQVIHLTDDQVTIKTAESTRLIVSRSKIAKVLKTKAEAGQPS